MIEQLKLYDPRFPKVRLGNPCDGGYVVPLQALCQSACLFSYGVGNDISLEIDYVEATNKKAFSFDHTCDFKTPAQYENKIIYFPEGLSGNKTEKTDNFANHYNKYFNPTWDQHANTFFDKVLLKIDVEGNEYEYLARSDIQHLSKITTGLLIEFHGLSDKTTRSMFFDCMSLLNQYFYLCHVHGNNNSDNFYYSERIFDKELNDEYIQKFFIPDSFELSFVSKEILSNAQFDPKKYPCPFLDRVNNILRPEANLDFLNQI
jgi:hypothetical protein